MNTSPFPAYNYRCFFQGQDELSQEASKLDQKNALALAIATTRKILFLIFLLNTSVHD